MFFSCTNLRLVSFRGSVREIQERTFSGCYELEQVLIPAGLEKIGVEAFYECTNLKHVVLPSTVKEIQRQAFTNDRYFEELVLPKSLERLEESVFHGCFGIKKLTIPGFLKEIPMKTFYGCKGLKELIIQEGVQKIGDQALGRCMELKSVELPQSITELGEGVFESCSHLKKIVLPMGLRRIGSNCFARCVELTEITFPDSLEEIGGNAFGACTGLADAEGFIVQKSTRYAYIGEKTELEVSTDINRISSGAFAENTKYHKIYIPENVTSIGAGTFRGCEYLRELRILSDQVVDLGEDPFDRIRGIITVTVCGMVPDDFTSIAHKTAVTLGFCENYTRFTKERSRNYAAYIVDHKDYILQRAIEEKLLRAVKYFTDTDSIEQQELSEILEYAQQKKAMDIIALLLDYRNKHKEIDHFSKYDF